MSVDRTRALAAGALLAAVAVPGGAVAAAPLAGPPAPDTTASADSVPELGEVVRYRVSVRSDERAESTWQVVQGPDVATLLPPRADGDDLESAFALSGPAVEGGAALVRPDRGMLVPVWPDGPVFRPGLAGGSGRSRTVLRSLDYSFERGERDREIFGRRAQHWVLEADLRVVFRPGMPRLGEDSAEAHLRTDFWFLREVPFTWSPLIPDGVNALSLGVEPVDRLLRRDLEPKLQRLGLPVVTETEERWEGFGSPDVALPTDGRRGVRVRDLRAAPPPAAHAPYLDLPLVTSDSAPAGRRGVSRRPR